MEQELKKVLRDSGLLIKALGEERTRFENFISPTGYENNQKMFEIAGCAKTLLRNVWQLGEQTVLALQCGSLFLGLIGVRTSLEYAFRIRYIFDHPKHRKDKEWTGRLAIELIETQPGLAGLKKRVNEFDKKSLKDLVHDAEVSEFYEKEYASLCHFSHPTCSPVELNGREMAMTFTAQASVKILTLVCDCLCYASVFWEYSGPHELKHQINALADEVDKKFPMPPP